MMLAADTSVYVDLLQKWVRGALPYLYVCPDRPELACYGTGENTWGVQTNQKAFAAFATVAADPRFRPDEAGVSSERLKEIALQMLRFSLQSHIEGDYHCTDNTSWGHTWISVLGLERMMHGVEAVGELLTQEDRSLLQKVLLSECDWLLDHYDVVGGLYNKDGKNKPESNLWNGALLLRTVNMYPDCTRAEQYRERGLCFLINSLSVPSDEADESLVDGKTVAERFKGANFFETMALNHHGYLNVGYMVICLSNMAMLHFMYRRQGGKAPDALYRHMRKLWEVVKLCTFPDGRLLRIGGDTRVRYTYCQDYVIPVWLMIADLLGDEGDRFEEGWLRQVRLEMESSGDGTFLSERCGPLSRTSPLYFTRLESDRAVALSMGLAWNQLVRRNAGTLRKSDGAEAPVVSQEASGQAWSDSYHGAYMHRSERRVASWVWESAEKPQGVCLPTDASDMAEWKENLSVQLRGLGKVTEQRLERHDGQTFQGGFMTWGSTLIHTQGQQAEGQKDHDIARSRMVCAALPDDTHMIVIQYTAALERRIYLHEAKGLHLLMPNDLFNGNLRTYYFENGESTLQGAGSAEETVHTGSRWLNVEDRLGVIAVYGTKELSIYRPGRRQIGLKEKLVTAGSEGMLYADEICGPCDVGLQSVDPNQVIVDAGYVLQAGESREMTRRYADTGSSLVFVTPQGGGCIRNVCVKGADGHKYILAVNFGNTTEKLHIQAAELRDLVTGELIAVGKTGTTELMVQPLIPRLVRFPS